MINFVDEVLNTISTGGKIKYNVTHSNGTSEVVEQTLATPVTTQGTPLNKALFDSIKSHLDLIGKYNAPTVASSASVTTGSYIPDYGRSTTDPTGFQVTATTENGNPAHILSSYFTARWDGTMWQIMLDNRITAKEISIEYINNGSGVAPKITVLASNDGSNFEKLQVVTLPTATGKKTITVTLGNKSYKHYQLRATKSDGEYTTTQTMDLYEFKITKWIAMTTYNNYTLSNYITSYEKGQRVLFQIPSTYAGGGIRLNVHSLGYKNIVPPADYQYEPNKNVIVYYDGTNFIPDINL